MATDGTPQQKKTSALCLVFQSYRTATAFLADPKARIPGTQKNPISLGIKDHVLRELHSETFPKACVCFILGIENHNFGDESSPLSKPVNSKRFEFTHPLLSQWAAATTTTTISPTSCVCCTIASSAWLNKVAGTYINPGPVDMMPIYGKGTV